jgi:hypothetical protein
LMAQHCRRAANVFSQVVRAPQPTRGLERGRFDGA